MARRLSGRSRSATRRRRRRKPCTCDARIRVGDGTTSATLDLLPPETILRQRAEVAWPAAWLRDEATRTSSASISLQGRRACRSPIISSSRFSRRRLRDPVPVAASTPCRRATIPMGISVRRDRRTGGALPSMSTAKLCPRIEPIEGGTRCSTLRTRRMTRKRSRHRRRVALRGRRRRLRPRHAGVLRRGVDSSP